MPPNFRGRSFLNRLYPEIFGGRFSSICYAPEFRGRSFVNRLCHRTYLRQGDIFDSPATELLPLTNQTKLSLTVTLTLTDTVTVIL